MKQRKRKFACFLPLILCFCIALSGCDTSFSPANSSAGNSPAANSPAANSPVGNSQAKDSQTKDSSAKDSSAKDSPDQKGSRDNTSLVLEPVASGVSSFACDIATIDVSNASEGYIMANYTGTNEKVKLQIKGPDSVTYTYNLHGAEYEVFPLTAGDGTYTVGIFENISGTKYSTAISTDFNVTITNTFGPYLYPNQYVNFISSSLPVAKAVELAYPANTELEVVEYVYNYIIENFTYDYDKASSVASGYLPVVDVVYESGSGICFDYAALMATMLRSQNIPTRLEVGYLGEEYHAWISTYIQDMGWVNGVIKFDGTSWSLMDPTYASASKSPKRFLTEDSKYLTKYVY